MFLDALQSYYGPIVTLVIFIIVIINDRLFSDRVRNFFLLESAIIIVIICATWIDGCLSVMPPGKYIWKIRNITSFLNFFLSPCSPAILIAIYHPCRWKTRLGKFLFELPLLCNMVLCILSIKYGFVFGITPYNTYYRGIFFMVPFIAAFFYVASLVFFSWKQKSIHLGKGGRREESK